MSAANFFDKVYEIVKKIPEGRVTTYGAIAECLGIKSSARAVGWALNKSITSKEFIPAHRVVNRNGFLTGRMHFPSPDMMKRLLESEGVKIENNKVVDFEKLFWKPCEGNNGEIF
jgi:methylated-DNA-protein-cysteine methyltransferase-like protein